MKRNDEINNTNNKKSSLIKTIVFALIFIIFVVVFGLGYYGYTEYTKNKSLEEHFGNVELSDEEINKLAKDIVYGDNSQKYSDDIINLKFNPDYLTVQKLNSPGMSYSLLISDKSKEFDTSSLYNNSVVYVFETDTVDDIYKYYKSTTINEFRLLFSNFINSALQTSEITTTDIVGDTSGNPISAIKCEKSLSDGRQVKAKLLYMGENKSVYALYSVIPYDTNIDKYTDVYNSIAYNR